MTDARQEDELPPEFVYQAGRCRDGRSRAVNPAWLVAVRQAAGLTSSAMAKALWCSGAVLRDVEHGRSACPDWVHAGYRRLLDHQLPTAEEVCGLLETSHDDGED